MKKTLLAALTLAAASVVTPPTVPAHVDVAGISIARPGVAQQAAPTAAVADYYNEYATLPLASGWDGNYATCSAGTTRPEYRQQVLARINFMRRSAGLLPVIENATTNADAQAAALSVAAGPLLSHTIAGYPCATPAAINGAALSNLSALAGPAAIDDFIREPGTANAAVGHRTWLLSPGLTAVGIGSAEPPAGRPFGATAVNVADPRNYNRQVADNAAQWVTWPPNGSTPAPLVHQRWSAQRADADLSQATVTVSTDGVGVPTTVTHRTPTEMNYRIASPVIAFEPAGVRPGATYAVTVSGATTPAGAPLPAYSYTVTVFDTVSFEAAAVRTYGPAVDAMFRDLAGRAPTAVELSIWAGQLHVNGGNSAALTTRLTAGTNRAQVLVRRMYRDTLGREPDQAGLEFWTARIGRGERISTVAAAFYSSPEYIQRFAGGSHAAWIDDLYAKLLNRTPDTAGHAHWTQQAQASPQVVALQFFQSPESRRQRVQRIYQEFLGRSPEPAGLEFWSERLAVVDDITLTDQLIATPEYLNRRR